MTICAKESIVVQLLRRWIINKCQVLLSVWAGGQCFRALLGAFHFTAHRIQRRTSGISQNSRCRQIDPSRNGCWYFQSHGAHSSAIPCAIRTHPFHNGRFTPKSGRREATLKHKPQLRQPLRRTLPRPNLAPARRGLVEGHGTISFCQHHQKA